MCPHGVPIAFDWGEYLKLAQEFKNSSNRRCRKIGMDLDRMRKNRGIADYKDVVWGLSSMESYTLTLAQRVISTLSSIP